MGRGPNITEDMRHQMYTLASQGVSVQEIADKIGCKTDTVQKYLKLNPAGPSPLAGVDDGRDVLAALVSLSRLTTQQRKRVLETLEELWPNGKI